MTTEWRTRWTHAQTRGRQIERQADCLRRALVRLADGEGCLEDVTLMAGAIREQLELAENLAHQLTCCTVPQHAVPEGNEAG